MLFVFGMLRFSRKILLIFLTFIIIILYKNIEDIKKIHDNVLLKTTLLRSSFNLYHRDKRKILNAKLKFISDWKLITQYQVNSSRLIGGCSMKWKKSEAIPWLKKKDRTDTENSYMVKWNIRPAGEFSRIILQTQYLNKTIKRIGGDYWRVSIRGASAIPVFKTDLNNGTYEFLFLPLVHGQYYLNVVLEYTLCDGIKEPPVDWFIKGNIQGKEQHHGILFHDIPYINKTLWSNTQINFIVPQAEIPQTELNALHEDSCKGLQQQCSYLWNGLGSWLNNTHWKPLCEAVTYKRYPHDREGILWIFGDSVASQFYHQIKKNRICKEIFHNCLYSYNWIYSLENYNITLKKYIRRNSTIEKQLWDENDFNVSKVIEEFKQAVLHPAMQTNKSVLLFNFGLHYTEATNYSNYKLLINSIIKLKKTINCKLIWRTSTSLNRHKYSMPNLHSRRFMTSQRLQLYNTYATNRFCHAGFDVLDIYPLTDSYPLGTGSIRTPHDPVHYEYHVMKPMEMLLEKTFEQNVPVIKPIRK